MTRAIGVFIGVAALGLSAVSCGSTTATTTTGPDTTKDGTTAGAGTTTAPPPAKIEPPPPPPPPPAKMYTAKYKRKPIRLRGGTFPTSLRRSSRMRAPNIYKGLDDVLRRVRPMRRVGKTTLADKRKELAAHLKNKPKLKKGKKGKKARKAKRRRVRKAKLGKKRKKAKKGLKAKKGKKAKKDKLAKKMPKRPPVGFRPAPPTKPPPPAIGEWENTKLSLMHDIARIQLNVYRAAHQAEANLHDRIKRTRSYYTRRRLRMQLPKLELATKKALTAAEAEFKKLAAEKKLSGYTKLDQALFDYGLLHYLAGQNDKSKAIWDRVAKEAPKSRLLPLVHLTTAEQAFDKNTMAEAERLYTEAQKTARYGFLAGYIAYKLGWVHHRLNHQNKAMRSFYTAYRRTRYNRRYRELRESAMRGYVRAYAETGDASRAYMAFRRLDYRRAFEMVQLLGELYRAKNKAADALSLSREMLRRRADHVLACSWQLDITLDEMRRGNRKAQLQAFEKWVKVYTSQRDRWGLIPPSEVTDCSEGARRIAGTLTRLMHVDAQKSGNEDDFKAAVTQYGRYLSMWPKARDSGMMKFYLADLHWQQAEKPSKVDVALERFEKLAATYDGMVTGRNWRVRLQARSAGALAHANVASIYADQSLGKYNKKIALERLKKACDYRHKESCAERDKLLGKLKPVQPDPRPEAGKQPKAKPPAPKKPAP